MSSTKISAILDYWFDDLNLTPAYFYERIRLWFYRDKKTDELIREKFEAEVEKAANGELKNWEETPEGLLAKIILLDQFSMNIYRGQGKAYLNSERAIPLSEKMIDSGWIETLTPAEKLFVYLPFEHAENKQLQERSVRLFRDLVEESPLNLKKDMEFFLDYAKRHQKVVNRFGRFPNRNSVLRRENTPDENAFLSSPESPF